MFGTRFYFRPWLAEVTSSTGDSIGLIAILAIAARIPNNSGAASYAFPAVRIALWGGGLVMLAAGWWARYSIGHARRMQRAGTNPGPAGVGAT